MLAASLSYRRHNLNDKRLEYYFWKGIKNPLRVWSPLAAASPVRLCMPGFIYLRSAYRVVGKHPRSTITCSRVIHLWTWLTVSRMQRGTLSYYRYDISLSIWSGIDVKRDLPTSLRNAYEEEPRTQSNSDVSQRFWNTDFDFFSAGFIYVKTADLDRRSFVVLILASQSWDDLWSILTITGSTWLSEGKVSMVIIVECSFHCSCLALSISLICLPSLSPRINPNKVSWMSKSGDEKDVV